MGLEYVELVLLVEETFAIRIEDDEAGRVGTLGDLRDLVLAKLAGVREQRCVSSGVFYGLRRALTRQCGTPRAFVRRHTRLDDLLPPVSRRRDWSGLAAELDLELPRLARPYWLFCALTGLSLAAGVWVVWWSRFTSLSLQLAEAAAVSTVVGCALVRLTRPWAVRWPAGLATVGDAVLCLVVINRKRLAGPGRGAGDVRALLCSILESELDVPRNRLVPEAWIVADLGLG